MKPNSITIGHLAKQAGVNLETVLNYVPNRGINNLA
jgi:hypothetical protein